MNGTTMVKPMDWIKLLQSQKSAKFIDALQIFTSYSSAYRLQNLGNYNNTSDNTVSINTIRKQRSELLTKLTKRNTVNRNKY